LLKPRGGFGLAAPLEPHLRAHPAPCSAIPGCACHALCGTSAGQVMGPLPDLANGRWALSGASIFKPIFSKKMPEISLSTPIALIFQQFMRMVDQSNWIV